MHEPLLNKRFKDLNCCVIIPTYNNQNTIEKIILDTLVYTNNLIVVNDGATDNTPELLKQFEEKITIIHQPKNYGKGIALRTAFKNALDLNYRYAITIDSDGQHFPSDFETFLNKIEQEPDSLIIGARNMQSENVPEGSTSGNKISTFWYKFETGIELPDTQSGYRLYPIKRMGKLRYFTSRFEFEIEVIVKAAWRGIPVISVPVKIYYAKGEERITHFRPRKDFMRISYLHTYFSVLAFLWYKPKMFLGSLSIKNIKLFFKENLFDENESVLKKSLSVAVGIFFGIVPIWGYQLITAIAAAYLLKLNKAIVIVAANISIPVMLPLILYSSLKTGELATGIQTSLTIRNISLETIESNLYVYLVGACVLSVVFALFMGLAAYISISMMRNKKSKVENKIAE